MGQERWREAVVEYIRGEAQPVDKFGHQPRLYGLAVEIAGDPEVAGACDEEVLFAAAWMHDLGVFVGHRPADPAELAGWDHVPYTIARSRELLAGWGFPVGKLEAVADVIRTHQPQDEPRTLESVVLRDADMLEQLGAVGALRAFTKVGRDTRYHRWTEVVPVLERALERLPGLLRLERSRRLAEGRVECLRGILEGLRQEAGDWLC
jgi:uncharacterized protein